MAISFTDKTTRVLRLLLGLRYKDVSTALRAYGFTDKVQREGWDLLSALGDARGLATRPMAEAKVIEQLDAFENRWFPIVQTTLARHYPAVEAKFFQNLSQVTGPEVAITVQLFMNRYDTLAAEGSSFGPEGVKAKEILTERGLTPVVIGEVRGLLEALRHSSNDGPSNEQAKAEAAKAEEALWAWYLEWSQVVRTAIKNRWLLHQMGFLTSSGSPGADAVPENGATTTDGAAAPAAATH
jgi:hypothetical protein